MKLFAALATASLIMFVAAGFAGAQWGGSGPCPQPLPVWQPVPVYRVGLTEGWKDLDGDWWSLSRDGRQLGCWSAKRQLWRPYDGSRFGEASDPPEQPPEAARAERRNFGVDCEGCSGKRCSINGHDASMDEVLEYVQKRSLADDTSKPCITVVGPDAKRVAEDLASAPELKGVREQVRFKAYPVGHWRVRQYGLKTGITLQAAPVGGEAVVVGEWPEYKGAKWFAEQLFGPTPAPQPAPQPAPEPAPKPVDPKPEPQPVAPEDENLCACLLAAALILAALAARSLPKGVKQ